MNNYLSNKLRVISFFLINMIVYVHSYNIPFHLNTDGDVLSGYNSFIQYFISQGIFRLPTPFFFSISGYLFFLNLKGSKNEFTLKIKKRIKTVAVPYLLWSAWGLLFYFILQLLPESRVFFKKGLIKDYSNNQLLTTMLFDPIPGQLWFLRDLIMLSFLSPIIYFLIKYFNFSIVLFFLFTWFYDFEFVLLSNRALLFFTFGAFLSTKKDSLIQLKFSDKSWLYTLLWISIYFIKTFLIYSNYRNLFILETLHKTGIIVGIWAVWNLYDYLFSNVDWTKIKFYKYFSFSFFLYAFHEPVLTIIRKMILVFAGKGEVIKLLLYLAAPILTIFFSWLVGNYLKRLIPQFYDIITGRR